MITKTLKTLTGKLQVSIPERLEEVTLGQLIAMQAAEKLSDMEAISILSGIAMEDLQNISHADELEIFNLQVLNLAHQITHLYNSDAIPQNVTFNMGIKGVVVEVNKNLSMEPAGAFMASREIIAEEISRHIQLYGEADWQQHFNPSLTACAQILAQYFYCRATGNRYNDVAAAEFEEQVKKLPVTEALPISKYFFLSYPSLSTRKTSFWHRTLRRWKNARELNSLSRLNTLIP